jgi:siroheme synthase (precorrin-2 oxidase/ferrochelatase)
MSSANRGTDPAETATGRRVGSVATDEETTRVGLDVRVPESRAVVVGGGQLGRLIARRLSADLPVHYVDDDVPAVERAARRHEATHVADLTDGAVLAPILDGASLVVVATPRDATNLLVAQHCLRAPGAPQVVVVVADPRTHDAYPPDVVRLCAASVLVDALSATLRSTESPATGC